MLHFCSVKSNLSKFNPGESARIVNIAEHEIAPKLIEMGLYPGKLVRILFRAPFHGPFAVDAGGTVISLREEEAALIQTTSA